VPAAAAVVAAAGTTRPGGLGGALTGASSALPPDDPTAAAPAGLNAGQDLAMLVGGLLLTAGGVFGVVGLLRAAGMRTARA